MNTSKTVTVSYSNIINVALAVIIAFLLWKGCSGDSGPALTTTTSTSKVEYQKIIDSAINTALSKQKPEKVPYIVYRDRIYSVKDTAGLNLGATANVRNLNVYKDTTKLKNATVYSEITSDGVVYGNKVTAEVEKEIITNTITKETKVFASGVFISGGAGVNNSLGLDNVNLGLDYIHKNEVGTGVNVQYNFITKQPIYGVKVSKKIF